MPAEPDPAQRAREIAEAIEDLGAIEFRSLRKAAERVLREVRDDGVASEEALEALAARMRNV